MDETDRYVDNLRLQRVNAALLTSRLPKHLRKFAPCLLRPCITIAPPKTACLVHLNRAMVPKLGTCKAAPSAWEVVLLGVVLCIVAFSSRDLLTIPHTHTHCVRSGGEVVGHKGGTGHHQHCCLQHETHRSQSPMPSACCLQDCAAADHADWPLGAAARREHCPANAAWVCCSARKHLCPVVDPMFRAHLSCLSLFKLDMLRQRLLKREGRYCICALPSGILSESGCLLSYNSSTCEQTFMFCFQADGSMHPSDDVESDVHVPLLSEPKQRSEP